MDVNETLAEIRSLSAKIADDEYPHDHEAQRLAELCLALDEWLSRGGFLPTPWAR